ncbi:MATE family efflux transporter [Clostridium botulinum]|uniref:MATE family efflux transporter n=1 Tax=Clostridium botulinum TaxID=1491 RepID=UPI000773542B|nr:MATE family efflux transporter [Clostridium botulinum]NFH78972.1 MATE family efflux transporter [Clostridium botulinum]NFH82778.1 MATE family efflux transporter [Clostridium botulinum]NFI10963.1 MATE family efflux transporter [Clostridium botulinum]NFI13787.1 MATE family efflux transporter [Clostridium botulinum]NFO83236.1 MATE family efflux transporter [Clostridium botulinum]
MNLILSKNNNTALNKDFFKYVIPSITSMWISALYIMVDAIFVSKGVSSEALAAVNLAMPYTNFIFGLSVLFSIGSSTVISISLGKGENKKAKEYFSITIVLLTIISSIICIFSLIFLDEICLFLGATNSILPMVKSYLGVIILFIVFYIVSYALEVLIKTDGYPHLSTIGVIISALTNIVLDYVFVMKFNWGLEGAALATGLARLFSFVFFMSHFLGKNSKLKFCKFKFEMPFIKRIMSIGFSDCATELSLGIIILLFNQCILMFLKEDALITYSVISYVNTMVLSTMLGISQGLQPLCSYYYGTRDKKTIKYLFSLSLKVVFVSSVFIFLICILFTEPIVLMFIDKSDMSLFNYTAHTFKIFSISFLILGFNVVTSGFLASLEKSIDACKISLGRGLFILSISLFLMIFLFGGNGIWISTIVSEIIVLIFSLLLLRKNLNVLEDIAPKNTYELNQIGAYYN